MPHPKLPKYSDELKEIIKAYLNGEPIEIMFMAGERVWVPFPERWGLETFDHYPYYQFRLKNQESFVTWGD